MPFKIPELGIDEAVGRHSLFHQVAKTRPGNDSTKVALQLSGCRFALCCSPLLPILSRQNPPPPTLVVNIPLDRAAQPFFKRDLRLPRKLALDFA